MAISESAKQRMRRRKAARRAYRDLPLFMLDTVNAKTEQPYSSQDELWNDLPVKTKPRRERFKKTPLVRYGRYAEIERLKVMYNMTGEVEHLIKAQRLRKHITKPYQLLIQDKTGKQVQWQYPATMAYRTLLQLVALSKKCQTVEEYEQQEAAISNPFHNVTFR